MQINVDWNRCIHSGMCLSAAPSVFDINDSGEMFLVNGAEVSADDLEGVQDAVACCPVEALSLRG